MVRTVPQPQNVRPVRPDTLQAEDDTLLMLQEVSERLQQQREVVEECRRRKPSQVTAQADVAQQLEQEHELLARQLRELRGVRREIETELRTMGESLGQRSSKSGDGAPAAKPSPRAAWGEPPLAQAKVPRQANAMQKQQREAAAREDATRRQLEALKQEMRAEALAEAARGSSRTTPASRRPEPLPMMQTPTFGRTAASRHNLAPAADAATAAPEPQRPLSRQLGGGRASPDKHFAKAYGMQRGRIQRIRATIRAAEVIQRAWRSYVATR